MSPTPHKTKPKILVIVGPTAVGKSGLAIQLARKYNGEVISADSRQVYSRLNIGTGKVTKKEMGGIPHHLLDVVDPKKQFSVVRYVALAEQAITDIIDRGKLPIICGGTGFYIQALVDGIILPDVPPNKKLREKLSTMTADQLLRRLKKLDPVIYKTIEKKNLRRVIRAIEIATTLGKVPKIKTPTPKYDPLFIGLNVSADKLRAQIHTRLLQRLKAGMIAEARRLHTAGLSWKRMNQLGLEYRYLALHLQGKMTKEEMAAKLVTEIWRYTKRQMTWFKKDSRISWYTPDDISMIIRDIRAFLGMKT